VQIFRPCYVQSHRPSGDRGVRGQPGPPFGYLARVGVQGPLLPLRPEIATTAA
jgi:hypothetical protein